MLVKHNWLKMTEINRKCVSKREEKKDEKERTAQTFTHFSRITHQIFEVCQIVDERDTNSF